MSEMVERVAKALLKLRMRQDPLMFEDAARAAIEAMREPTEEMRIPESARELWRSMIDEVLK